MPAMRIEKQNWRNNVIDYDCLQTLSRGGEGEIRTHGAREGAPVFKSVHSHASIPQSTCMVPTLLAFYLSSPGLSLRGIRRKESVVEIGPLAIPALIARSSAAVGRVSLCFLITF